MRVFNQNIVEARSNRLRSNYKTMNACTMICWWWWWWWSNIAKRHRVQHVIWVNYNTPQNDIICIYITHTYAIFYTKTLVWPHLIPSFDRHMHPAHSAEERKYMGVSHLILYLRCFFLFWYIFARFYLFPTLILGVPLIIFTHLRKVFFSRI